jgi:hypothetical protein
MSLKNAPSALALCRGRRIRLATRTRNLPIYAPLALLLASASAARADVILYSTGFENPPFTTGTVAGQDGWNVFGPGVSTIENTFARTGSQAVLVDGSPAGQSGPFRLNTSTGPLIDLSADIAIFASSNQSVWQFAASDSVHFLGGINIGADNSIVLDTLGFTPIGTFPRATAFDSTAWHNIDLLFNITTQTYNLSLDGSLLASNVPFCGANAGCTGGAVSSYGAGFFDSFGGGNDSGYMDNFRVAVVTPEPSSIALMVSALGVVFLELRRRSIGAASPVVRERQR